MAKRYGLLNEAEFDALMKDARHSRGSTLIDHFAWLIAAVRKVFTIR